jgi:hypothetical protein
MIKLSAQEIIEQVQKQMTLASNKIKELKSQLGDPIGTQDHVTEDDMLIFDIEYWNEKLQSIKHTIN